jgi:cupin 2 domain-containing protein
MPQPSNVFTDIPGDLTEELVQNLVTTKSLCIERIVSLGHVSPAGFWYDQEMHEWILLIQGAARLRFEGEDQPIEMKPGSMINIPPHQRHRVEWTDPNTQTIWLAVHYRQ